MPRPFIGEIMVFSTMMLEQLNSFIQKNEVRLLPHIMYKYQLKMDKDLNVKVKTIKFLEGNRFKSS